jgi:pantothenate kinase
MEALVARIAALAASGPGRVIVAIAGAPGSGKSTLAEAICARLGPEAALVPMDGFHLDNAILDARGRRFQKGSPDTFDTAGFEAMLLRLRAGGASNSRGLSACSQWPRAPGMRASRARGNIAR